MPMLTEADAAAAELRSLGEAQPVGTFAQRRLRAGLLLKGKRYQQAVTEYSPLVEHAPSADLSQLQAEFAGALYHAKRRDEAQHLFEGILRNTSTGAETKAQALYYLAE